MKMLKEHKKFIYGFIAGTILGPMIVGKVAPGVKAKIPS